MENILTHYRHSGIIISEGGVIMLLKDYIKLKKMSIRQIAIDTNTPYSTLNDLVNQKTDYKRTSFGVICVLADKLEISIDELRRMLSEDSESRGGHDENYSIVVRNKSYYIDIEGHGREYLCKVNPVASFSIDDIAFWKYRDYIIQKEMEKIDAVCVNAPG